MFAKINPMNCPKPGLMLMGLLLACCSAFLTAQAGYELHGVTMAGAFVICTFGACFVPHEFTDALRSGRYGSALFALLLAAFFIVGEFAGEVMVMSAARGKTDQSAQVQNARYVALEKGMGSLEAQLKLAQEKLASQNEYGSAASYEAGIKEAEALAARESSKERNGCKKKCDEALAVAKDLRTKQAIAIDRETNTKPEVDRLTAKIEATRSELKTTNKGFSESGSQVALIQRVVFGSNDEGQRSRTDDFFTLFIAALFTIGSMGLTWAAKQNYEDRKVKGKTGERPILTLIKSASDKLNGREPAKPAASAQVVNHREMMIMDPRSACMQLAGHGKCA